METYVTTCAVVCLDCPVGYLPRSIDYLIPYGTYNASYDCK
jgi:hypothetical protein